MSRRLQRRIERLYRRHQEIKKLKSNNVINDDKTNSTLNELQKPICINTEHKQIEPHRSEENGWRRKKSISSSCENLNLLLLHELTNGNVNFQTHNEQNNKYFDSNITIKDIDDFG